MKTETKSKSRVFTTFMVLLGVIIISSCGYNSGQEVNSSQNESKSAKPAKAPSMDLHTAVITGNLEIVRKHVESGSDLNIKDPIGGSTPLITAAVFGKTEIASLLIESGADLEIRNNEGSTALHTAAFLCREEIVRDLIRKGADKTILNSFGSTPLETVLGPFQTVKPFYEQIGKDLGPLGLKLDLERIETMRPVIADILKGDQ